MSGAGTTISVVTATGDQDIDGLLSGHKWADATIFYSFSLTSSAYSYTSSGSTDLPAHFRAFTDQQKIAAAFALDGSGNTAAVGFSFEGFTAANVQGQGDVDSTSGTHMRFAGTTSNSVPTAQVADFPGNVITTDQSDNGDIWAGAAYDGTIYDLRTPQAGNYAWYVQLHEVGHALGLKHPHETGWSFGGVPQDMDMMEFTLMSYRSYENADVNGGLTNSDWSFGQTYMMLDIAALQAMYGADYTTNAGATVYQWTPGSGDTLVNGAVAIDAGGNQIFMTVWDGGGTDTYDFSAYSSALSIDLRPGKWSTLDAAQLADLGDGHTARGSVYNALQYQGNTASLIENAIGGTGNDTIVGNSLGNVLNGRSGGDALNGGQGLDTASYASATSAVSASLAKPSANTGDAAGDSYISIENLLGSAFADTLTGNALANTLTGGGGSDTLSGGGGGDGLIGGSGLDTASYAGAAAGLSVSLAKPSGNTGEAAGDSYSSIENLLGSGFNDRLAGNDGGNQIGGGAGDDVLFGGRGDDRLFGSTGKDTLDGGFGIDTLTGGSGADIFLFDDGETGLKQSTADTIFDFSVRQKDRIDISDIDANTRSKGNQSFDFIGSDKFTKQAGELRFVQSTSDTYISGDVNGDGKTDFMIHLTTTLALKSGYFLL